MEINIKSLIICFLVKRTFKIYTFFLIISFLSTTSFANTQIPQGSLDKPSEQSIEASKKAVKALKGVRHAIDMKTTSLESMAEFLSFDPNNAVDYVTYEIGMLPYLGSMRGSIGAMETGSASVLDQALLLGGLLEIMGVDVVLAHGQLSNSDTNRLMDEALNITAPELAVDTNKLNQLGVPKSATSELQEKIVPSREDIDARLSKIYAELSGSLKPKTTDWLEKIKTHIGDNYVWVRYRDVPTDPWVDAHPAFSKAALPLPKVGFYSQVEVPKERGHTFGFKLILEVTKKGKVHETTLANFKPRLISELAGEQLDLILVPSGMNPTDISGSSKVSYFRPMINGESPKGAKAFSTRGNIVNAESVISEKSGAAAASLFGDLAAKLDSTDAENMLSQQHVTGLWLEAVYKNPFGKQVRRRPLIDLSTSKPGDLISATDAMLRTLIDFNIGQTNLARSMLYQANAMISQVQRMPYLVEVASGKMTMEAYNTEPRLLGLTNKEVWMSMSMMQGLYLPARYEEQIVLPLTALISTMTTSTIESRDKTNASKRKILDLMFTDTLVLSGNGAPLKVNREAGMRLGIFRTLAETIMVKGSMDKSLLTTPEGELIELNNKKALSLLIKERSLDTRTAERLTRDFNSAGTVLISGASNSDDLRWWKVDQASGEALGMGTLGGQAAMYAVFLNLSESNAISVAFFVAGVWSCAIDSANDASKLEYNENVANFKTCLAINVTGYVVGGHITALKTAQANLVSKFKVGFFVDVVSMMVGNELNSFVKSNR